MNESGFGESQEEPPHPREDKNSSDLSSNDALQRAITSASNRAIKAILPLANVVQSIESPVDRLKPLGLTANIAGAIRPLVDTTSLANSVIQAWNPELKTLVQDMQALLPNTLARFGYPVSEIQSLPYLNLGPTLKHLDLLKNIYTGGFEKSFQQALEDHRLRLLPPNLKLVYKQLNYDEVKEQFIPFIIEGGIPAFGIPRHTTFLKLMNLSPNNRRNAIWSHRQSIVTDCETWLRDDEVQRSVSESQLALEALTALQSGHFTSAQALFTVVLEALSERLLSADDGKNRRSIKDFDPRKDGKVPAFLQSQAEADEIYEMADLIAWLPICHAYLPFNFKIKGEIPREYNRHASTHTTSNRQFVKRNTIQVLMLATSLIIFTHWTEQYR
ncbi:MAG: hypothetical protein QM234_09045 [Acidobacteriota bacterium]|nr:hypothetical protein [Acidobacteriota bacterium]